MDLTSFLQWLVVSGGSISVVSFVFERLTWFQSLSSEAKDYTIFGAAAAVSCGAMAIVAYVPAETLAAIAPYFLAVSSIFATVFIGKAFHRVDKSSPKFEGITLVGTIDDTDDCPHLSD